MSNAADDKLGRVPPEYAYAAGDDSDLADQIARMTPEQRAESAANVQALMDEARPQIAYKFPDGKELTVRLPFRWRIRIWLKKLIGRLRRRSRSRLLIHRVDDSK